jgi:hypothetical protein
MLTGTPPREYSGLCVACDREHRLTNDGPTAIASLEALFARLETDPELAELRDASEFKRGKMIGVLVAEAADGTRHTLQAYSGELAAGDRAPDWAPTVLRRSDTAELESETLLRIADLSQQIEASESEREIQLLKAERRAASVVLSTAMFDAARVTNARGEALPLREIFAGKGIAGGTGHCAATKLLHAANVARLRPIALAEAWWGPTINGRVQGEVQPPCDRRCAPILGHLLCGLDG